MGWTGIKLADRKFVIDEITGDHKWEKDGFVHSRKCIAKTYKGPPFSGVLYAVLEIIKTDSKGVEVYRTRFISISLLQTRKIEGVTWWFYKEMEESMQPYSFGCPLKYFDLVPWCSLLFSPPNSRYRLENGQWEFLDNDKWEKTDRPWWQGVKDYRDSVRTRWLRKKLKRRFDKASKLKMDNPKDEKIDALFKKSWEDLSKVI